VETPFDAAVAQTLATGGFTLVAVIAVLIVPRLATEHYCRRRSGWPCEPDWLPSLARIAGGVMIATRMRLVFAGDPQLAYATGGWLKPVHSALMHGILVLPLLAWRSRERIGTSAPRAGSCGRP
jgi:hypothetical protein